MKFLLIAINAKYIHTNLAVYSIKSYAPAGIAPHMEIAEYTINLPAAEILADLYRRKPAVIAFSCYIWNWEMITGLLPELPKVLPGVPVWLGGPEVSFDGEAILSRFPAATGIVRGEGEQTCTEIAAYYLHQYDESTGMNEHRFTASLVTENTKVNGHRLNTFLTDESTIANAPRLTEPLTAESSGENSHEQALSQIKGLLYRQENGHFAATEARAPLDLNTLPFPYPDPAALKNRIIYYESSRGCPFDCSYCLSSVDKKLRFKDLSRIKAELARLLAAKVPQVKFVDRTFNCNHRHAQAIWQFIKEQDNGVTNFHFEIAADLLTSAEITLLNGMRPGLVQLEIGVQSTHEPTLDSIRRKMDFKQVREKVAALKINQNIHIHLDLIAGLPYEDYDTFVISFNEVYACQPEQLQLGFLKMLSGAPISRQAADYGMVWEERPPYQVLFTRWLSYGELRRLKRVEEMVELYYNSNQFTNTLQVLERAFPNPFAMYARLADFYEEKGYFTNSPARGYRYQVLLDFAVTADRENECCYRELLTYDLYLRENVRSRPEYAADLSPCRDFIRNFYKREEETRYYLPGYAAFQAAQLARMTHMEAFRYPVWAEEGEDKIKQQTELAFVLFDYQRRDALTQNAATTVIQNFKRNAG